MDRALPEAYTQPTPQINPREMELAGQANTLRRDWLIFVVLPGLVRLCLIGTFSLCEDEAYYWEWSRNLALGYHDQGPGVAVAIRLGTALFGHHEFGVRFPAVLLLTGALSFAFLLLHEMYGRRAAIWGAIALNVVPIFTLAGLLMLHEAVQAFFWSLALYAFWRALQTSTEAPSQASTLWWLLAGCGVGLAVDGKYTAILFLPAALLFLLIGRDDRRWLGRKEPWIALLAALAAVSPVLYWNHQHEWRSMLQVVSLGRPADTFLQPKYFVELIFSQFGSVSPILFGVMIWRMGVAWKRGVRGPERRERFLFLFTATYVAPFFVLALHNRVYPNWPSLGYLTGVMLVASWAAERMPFPGFARTLAGRCWRGGLALAAAMSLVLVLHLTLQILPIPGHLDPAKRFYGWTEMASWAESLAEGFSRNGEPTHYYAKTYQVASLLAFYVEGQPRVFEVKGWDRANQYDYWGDLPRGADALLIIHRNERVPKITRQSFATVEEIEGTALEIRRHGGVAQTFRAYHCRDYRPVVQP